MLIDTYSRKTGKSEQIDDSLMEKREWRDGRAEVIQYFFDGECVHESRTVQATGVQGSGAAAKIGPPGGG